MSRTLCIGLTGGIGSGKTTATEMFAELGVPCIDADDVSRQAVARGAEALQEIAKQFGTEVLDENGELNRRKMREIVFSDDNAREKLEAIIHPRVYEKINEFLDGVSFPYCIISSPLLIEKRSHYAHDRVLVVDLPESLQVERASKRDEQSEAEIAKIIHSQIPREQRLQAADDVISNDGDVSHLRTQVHSLHKQYLELASNAP